MTSVLDERGVYFVQHLVAQLESRGDGPDSRATAIDVALRRTQQRFGAQSALPLDLLTKHADGMVARLRSDPAIRIDPTRYEECLTTLAAQGKDPAEVLANVANGVAQLHALVTQGPRARDVLDVVATQPPPSPRLREELHRLLSAEPFDGKATVDFLVKHTGIGEILHEWSGVFESYSIGVHVQRFYDCYLAQRSHLPLAQLGLPAEIRFDAMMRLLAPLHDLGKAAAVESGDKDLQHAFTMPVVRRFFTDWGFTAKELALAEALVDNDVLGHVLNPRRNTPPAQGAEELKNLAAQVGLTPATFFALQAFFFTVDAGSYPYLEHKVFTREENGRLVPRSPRFAELAALCAA